MHRWDVINHFIKKHNYHSYLEIGYFKGWSFDNVHAPFKIAVDPNPSKTAQQEAMPINSVMVEAPHAIYKMASDDFFKHVEDGTTFRDHKWDIIFIDGLHEAGQVLRDIKNSLLHLKENGTIILHDCNPPTLAHATTGDAGGNWNGDVYKAFIQFRYENPSYDMFTIDTDWGIGVIKTPPSPSHPFLATDLFNGLTARIANDKWEVFDNNRKILLNLISVEEFLKREVAYETA